MTARGLAEQYYRYATGWLGWTPEVALSAPMPLIRESMHGLVAFHKATNPWGSGETDTTTVNAGGDDERAKAKKRKEVAKKTAAMFDAMSPRG